MIKTKHNVTIVTGPTAGGKSSYALDIAQEKDGLIINCDSMQIYDALHVLTAQPSAEDLEVAEHRLYGVLPAGEDTSAAHWRGLALEEIERAFALGKHPILVGGTGFYIKALIEGLSPIPDVDEDVRHAIRTRHEEEGQAALYEALQNSDPAIAQTLKPNDSQRTMRALEVLESTGRSLLDWQKEPLIGPPEHLSFSVIGLVPPKEKTWENIQKRLDIMVAEGALDEVRQLADAIERGDVSEAALIVKAHGFRPFRKYLNGDWSMEDAKDQTAIETRQYAKRQRTWIRQQYQDTDRYSFRLIETV